MKTLYTNGVFRGQHLDLSLSVNYVALNKDLEKLTTKIKAEPKLYSIKMKICFDQRYNDIGVVIATK